MRASEALEYLETIVVAKKKLLLKLGNQNGATALEEIEDEIGNLKVELFKKESNESLAEPAGY